VEALAATELDARKETRRSYHVAAAAVRHGQEKDPLALPSLAWGHPVYVVLLDRLLRGSLANKIFPSEVRHVRYFLADHGLSIRKRLIVGSAATFEQGRTIRRMSLSRLVKDATTAWLETLDRAPPEVIASLGRSSLVAT